MSRFEDEYYRRIRRVAGIYDDTATVELESGEDDGYWSGGCETCNFHVEGAPFVKIVQKLDEYPYRIERASFSDMGELIRALDEVDDESVG